MFLPYIRVKRIERYHGFVQSRNEIVAAIQLIQIIPRSIHIVNIQKFVHGVECSTNSDILQLRTQFAKISDQRWLATMDLHHVEVKYTDMLPQGPSIW